MKILGVRRESVVEWPEHLSYVVFVAGCNFRCGFCYVPELVLSERYLKATGIDADEVLGEIRERRNFIDGVCVTGGEPCIHGEELVSFLKKLKGIGLNVRLATNGSFPGLLERLIKDRLVDSIALDIKHHGGRYGETCGVSADIGSIEKSISLILGAGIDYEIRTTIVPGLHSFGEILMIGRWIYGFGFGKKIKAYVLQQFRSDLPNEETIDKNFMDCGNFSFLELLKMRRELEGRGWFERVEVRGE